ncbi:hypothetical protein F0U62_38605 [Cystobacter fuscus]|uniref:hypothetical protein n=1 Tax=Cystobacter fuscus TaxID=43 RepID=UPI002B32381D|nr:hypothetical protein F0U62_38605 [Cystobacter fuscus]
MSNLNNDLSPDQKQENGYFEYNAGHTGHITLTFRTSKADCTLGLVDIDVMPDRTVTEDGDLKITYTISTISGARFIAVTMVDN